MSVDQMAAMLASVGIHSEADMDAAQKWNESYIAGLSAFGALVHALNFVSWRFSFLGLFWLAVGLSAIFVGTSEFGFLGLVVGIVVVVYAVYLFAGGRTRFFVL